MRSIAFHIDLRKHSKIVPFQCFFCGSHRVVKSHFYSVGEVVDLQIRPQERAAQTLGVRRIRLCRTKGQLTAFMAQQDEVGPGVLQPEEQAARTDKAVRIINGVLS